MIPCTHSRHPVPEAAQQPQNITEPPPCLTVGKVFFSLRLHFVFCKHRDDVLHQKALIWSHLSTGHSPRRILTYSGVLWQTPVRLSYVSLSAVGSSWVSYHRTPFHLVDDEWCKLKLSYLVSESQLESVWQLIEVLSPPFEQSFAAIFNQVFSCGHVQGG